MVDDGRTTEHGYTISSPCEPDGSGELISCVMRKPNFGILTAKLISAFVFTTQIVQFLFYLIPKLLAFLCDCTGWFVSEQVGYPED